jgi:hypothetical protein
MRIELRRGGFLGKCSLGRPQSRSVYAKIGLRKRVCIELTRTQCTVRTVISYPYISLKVRHPFFN